MAAQTGLSADRPRFRQEQLVAEPIVDAEQRFVDVMDTVGEHDDFDPAAELGFAPKDPTEDEVRKMKGQPPYDAEPDDDKGYPPMNF